MRCFVAAELPGPVRDALARWTPRDDALRPVAPEAMHLTLAFLGERADGDAARAGALLGALARPVPALALGAARWLPRRRPRVLAVDVRDGEGALAALQAAVAAALVEEIGWRPERRAYLPHVTVARVRSGARTRPGPPPGVPAGPAFSATALTLLRSIPAPGGSRYEPVSRVALS